LGIFQQKTKSRDKPAGSHHKISAIDAPADKIKTNSRHELRKKKEETMSSPSLRSG
jgi:hypothetical protein